jgi:hypothetical protein
MKQNFGRTEVTYGVITTGKTYAFVYALRESYQGFTVLKQVL